MRIPTRILAIFLFALAPLGASAQLSVDAGDDVVIECSDDDGAEYTLNGSVSGGDDVSFSWSTEPAVALDDADTLTPTGEFPVGETTVTLEARDASGAIPGEASDSVTVTVEDSQPPVVQAKADPAVLWPPNHKMREVEVRIRARDRCGDDDDLEVELVSAQSNEPDNGTGDGNTTNDIQNADLGEDDREVSLRAERAGPGNGRVYTLTYRVTDGSGNATEAEAKVYVPKNFDDVRDRLEDEIGGDPEGPGEICVRPDDAAEQFVDAVPSIGDYPNRKSCQRACKVWSKGCAGIVKGTARCVRSEQKSLRVLGLAECRNEDGRGARAECRDEAKEEAAEALAELQEQTEAGGAICERVGRRCANACAELHDPDGDAFDDEGVDEE